MKKTEEIIKEKLDNREFAFDEKAWTDMEALLDAQEKRKKKGFFWYFAASMLVVLMAGGAYYYYSSKVQKLESSNVVTSRAPESYRDEGQNTPLTAIFTEKNDTKSEKRSETKTISSAIETQSLADGTTSSAIKTQSLADGTTSSAIKAQSLADGTTSPAIKAQSLADGTTSPAIKTQSLADGTTSPATETQSLADGTTKLANDNDSTKTTEQTDTIGGDLQSRPEENPLAAPGKETRNVWGVVAGLGIWHPYKDIIIGTDKKMFGFTGGFYYQRILSKRLELGVSAIYSSRGAANDYQIFTNSNYGFGVQSDKTIIAALTMHYLSIPVFMRLNVSPRSHFIIGTSYYQLLATTYEITHVTENSFGVLESNSEKQTGQYERLRKNDVAAFIGYELTLFDRMNAGIQFSYGFYDITKNYSQGKDHNISLQLHLKYDLIKH